MDSYLDSAFQALLAGDQDTALLALATALQQRDGMHGNTEVETVLPATCQLTNDKLAVVLRGKDDDGDTRSYALVLTLTHIEEG
jgi:hypothetical protein